MPSLRDSVCFWLAVPALACWAKFWRRYATLEILTNREVELISSYVWDVITALCLAAPFILVWGWAKYCELSTRSDWRSRASLVGLCCPLLSVVIWLIDLGLAHRYGWQDSTPADQRLTSLGVHIAEVGMLVGLFGRPKLIIAIVPTCAAAILFWFGTTLP